MMKKIRSRIGAAMMAAALTLTMSQPVILNAAESPADESSAEVQQIVPETESDVVVGDETQGDVLQDTADAKPEDKNNAQPEVKTETEDAETETSDVQDDEAQVSDDTSDVADEKSEPADDKVDAKDGENTDASDQTNVDINKPVLEKVEFDQQGKTLKEGDTVTFRIYAYDADTAVERVSVTLSYKQSDNYWMGETISGEYDETEGCYIASMTLQNIGTGKVEVSQIRVVDTNSNYVDYATPSDFWFETDGDLADAKVAEFNFPLKGQSVAIDDLFDGLYDSWVTLNKEIPDDGIILLFTSADSSAEIEIYYNWYESDQQYIFGGTSTRTPDESEEMKAELVLTDVYLERFGGYEHIPMDGMEDYTVTVDFSSENPGEAHITSVSLDKNGEIVRAGDKVTIKATVDNQEVMDTYGYAYFYSAADIDDNYKSVELTYDEEQKAYIGTFSVEKDTYPCEWYMTNLELHKKESSETVQLENFYPNIYNSYPWYFNVYSGDTFVSSAQDTSIFFYRQDANGYWTVDPDETIEIENAGRRISLSDLGVALPSMKSPAEGINQTGWIYDSGSNLITEDSILLNNYGNIALYAKYDQNRYNVTYNYVTDKGTAARHVAAITLDDDATVGDYREKAMEFAPDDMTDSYKFSGWSNPNAWADDSMKMDTTYSETFSAEYEGKVVVQLSKEYFDEKGKFTSEIIPLVLDSGATLDDVKDYAGSMAEPKLYPGLRFSKWEVESYNETDALTNFQYVYATAAYENCLIRYMIYDRDGEGVLDIINKVAEKGDSIQVRIDLDGYKDVEWVSVPEEDTIVVDSDLLIFEAVAVPDGSASEEPDDPDEPVTPEDPEDTPKPEEPSEPEQLPTEETNAVVEEIKNAAAGENVTVDMGSATVVSKEILEAAKGKDVDIVLDMGGYTWTINGEDIQASDLKDIDLEVTQGTANIPNNLISALAQGNPVQQISLTHNGNFGFRASLTLNVGSQFAGEYGNLYYYDSVGRMVFMNAGMIGEDGNVTLSFSHASDYAIVISDTQLSQADADRANAQVNASGKTPNAGDEKAQAVSVQTGDNANVLPIVMILIVSAAVVAGCVVIIRKKRMRR